MRVLLSGRRRSRPVELFLLSRGNLKEVERRLGVSYPTARARVDAMIDRLGLLSDERRRLETLEALIDVDAAMADLGETV